jgi:serine/threonine-protein kinase
VFEPGTLLAGKYRVDRVLGQGGMGVVVAATHMYLGQRVALKFLLPQFLDNQTTVERFLREARASAALRGEHVCRVSDVGTLETGSPYIVMELLDGSDLATLLAGRGPLPVELAAHHVLEACIGLAEAHALGIVHRDLKPANLFVTRRLDGTPLVKVLDFGIAKAQHDAVLDLTQTATVMGSPGYMSPEQLRSSRVADARSDIWALGVILYELVSGRPPFVANSITELALRVAMDPLPPLAIAVSSGFNAVIAQCLEKDPARRFQDVAALARALAPFAGPDGRAVALGAARVLHATPSLAIAHVPAGPGTPTTLSSSAGSATARRRPVPWIAVASAAVAAVVGILMITMWRGGSARPTAAPADPPAAAAPAASSVESAASPPGSSAAPPATPAMTPSPVAPAPAAPAATPAMTPSPVAPAPAAPAATSAAATPPPATPAPASPLATPETARSPAAHAPVPPAAKSAPTEATAAPSAGDAAGAASAASAKAAAGSGPSHKLKPRPHPAQPPATPPEDVGASRY